MADFECASEPVPTIQTLDACGDCDLPEIPRLKLTPQFDGLRIAPLPVATTTVNNGGGCIPSISVPAPTPVSHTYNGIAWENPTLAGFGVFNTGIEGDTTYIKDTLVRTGLEVRGLDGGLNFSQGAARFLRLFARREYYNSCGQLKSIDDEVAFGDDAR